jgi:hypothetical protein
LHPKSDWIAEVQRVHFSIGGKALRYAALPFPPFCVRIKGSIEARAGAMKAGGRRVLLLFKNGGSLSITSRHDGDGELRIAFAIPTAICWKWPRPACGRSKGFQSNQSVTLIEQTLHQTDCAFRDFASQLANRTLPAPEKRSLFGE